ncbi:hypothetical protein EDD18DRAFT_1108590 [Armillaria luteobubalina]|uniref:Uncharacterized protein n=1 Tax=Armillaria luteobubalina TaxID=153913 RepID=A0AA39PYL7_9AGAR|nr:hypothetical protein EDD18DRAFT_1108590 [Armillaria luteobubalina]
MSEDPSTTPKSRNPKVVGSSTQEKHPDAVNEPELTLLVPQNEIDNPRGKKRRALPKLLLSLAVRRGGIATAFKRLAIIGARRRVDTDQYPEFDDKLMRSQNDPDKILDL